MFGLRRGPHVKKENGDEHGRIDDVEPAFERNDERIDGRQTQIANFTYVAGLELDLLIAGF